MPDFLNPFDKSFLDWLDWLLKLLNFNTPLIKKEEPISAENLFIVIFVGTLVGWVIYSAFNTLFSSKKEDKKGTPDSKPKSAWVETEDLGLFDILWIPSYFTFLMFTCTYSPLEQF